MIYGVQAGNLMAGQYSPAPAFPSSVAFSSLPGQGSFAAAQSHRSSPPNSFYTHESISATVHPEPKAKPLKKLSNSVGKHHARADKTGEEGVIGAAVLLGVLAAGGGGIALASKMSRPAHGKIQPHLVYR